MKQRECLEISSTRIQTVKGLLNTTKKENKSWRKRVHQMSTRQSSIKTWKTKSTRLDRIWLVKKSARVMMKLKRSMQRCSLSNLPKRWMRNKLIKTLKHPKTKIRQSLLNKKCLTWCYTNVFLCKKWFKELKNCLTQVFLKNLESTQHSFRQTWALAVETLNLT